MGTTAKGVLSSIITCGAATLAGCFFVNWAVDHRIIWESPTESSIASALSYYHDRMESASWLNALLAGIAGVSITGTVVKIASNTTSTMLFDGGSLFLLLAAVFIYAQNVSPSLQEIAKLPRLPEKLTQAAFGSITQIASAHAVIATALTGVVLLQGAQAYSDRQVEKQVRKELKEAGIDPSYASAVLDSSSSKAAAASPASPVKASSTSSSSSSKIGGLAAPQDPSQNVRRSPRKRK
ncbi:hypothetical protein P389DRAFT_187904 [Cystobasidium minutum MCA 4210]|uniref:uncharacterized protein n=1 Tax=Cystobasidium minutum MCA 4210 TaxID=1397322 RepID=UPI0034CD6BDB|eukprot:jgi/Rhomi1/187904/estExt_fgenesh1_pg.C_2_t10158